MLVMDKVDNCWELSKFEGYQSLSIAWGPKDIRIFYYDY